ncbi:MAG: hypothetical protein ABEI77_08135 [Halorientalis sp.]
MELTARTALLYGLVVGLVIGAVGGATFAGPNQVHLDNSTLPTSVSSASSTCYDGPRKNAGWVHVVAGGRRWTTTLNATVVHPQGTDVRVNVSQRPTGTYEIALETVPHTSEKPLQNESCQAATTLNVATALPKPHFVVTMNGRVIREVDQDETTANLYPLPNPINATG